MKIVLQRAYDAPPATGYRVLVDRLWPRGVTKEKAAIDEWCKDVAPSTALRTWFGHDPAKWAEFQRKYKAELKPQAADLRALLKRAKRGPLVLVYGAKDEEHNQAVVLKAFLSALK